MSQSAGNSSQQHFDTHSPRRQHQAYTRQPDELHMNDPSSSSGSSSDPSQPQQQQKDLRSPRDYASAPRINLEQAPTSPYSSSNLPGPLQSGSGNPLRPPLSSSNSTPGTMSQDPFSTPLRGSGLAHGYSRSSPSANYESGQGAGTGQYQAYTSTPSGAGSGEPFSTPSSSSLKYAPGQQQRNVSNTPLGLADIRPRADSNLSDAAGGGYPYGGAAGGGEVVATNSNYVAPWAIYAFDWCKWPSHNGDAGKVAVGSYLEDGHNFVGDPFLFSSSLRGCEDCFC